MSWGSRVGPAASEGEGHDAECHRACYLACAATAVVEGSVCKEAQNLRSCGNRASGPGRVGG